MGKDKRSGFGYGMNESEARRDFENSLDKQYGSNEYNGSSQDITQYLKSKCVDKPIDKQIPNKAKGKVINEDKDLKLVNGFLITNETSDNLRNHLLSGNSYDEFNVNEEVALTLKEAKDKSAQLSLMKMQTYHIIPTRIFQNKVTHQIFKPKAIYEVKPEGGKESKKGKWSFQVEVRI